MNNKKFNLAKVVWLILLCFGITFFSANNSQAIPIDVTSIDAYYPVAGGYLTQYYLNTSDYGRLDAFCVEEVGINLKYSYELVPVPDRLSGAAKIASQYYEENSWSKPATQIAIWVLVFDNFSYNSGLYYDEVDDILTNYNKGFLNIIGPIGLVQSPADGTPGESQDYLVRLSVPDASIMFLLGPALLGLGLLGRRRRKSKK